VYLPIYLVRYLLMKKIKIQMLLLYILTKKLLKLKNLLNPFGIILFYKMVWWFDGQNISVKPKKPRSNFLYQYMEYIYSYIYFIHVCQCIVSRWVVDR